MRLHAQKLFLELYRAFLHVKIHDKESLGICRNVVLYSPDGMTYYDNISSFVLRRIRICIQLQWTEKMKLCDRLEEEQEGCLDIEFRWIGFDFASIINSTIVDFTLCLSPQRTNLIKRPVKTILCFMWVAISKFWVLKKNIKGVKYD